MAKIIKYILVLFLAVGMQLSPTLPAVSSVQTDLFRLPITFPAQSSAVIEYFNRISRPDDIASFPSEFTSLLSQVQARQKMIGYASWEQAEHDLELIQENIDFVMYNPEHWSNTPLTEQQNLEAVVIKAADFTHAHGWQFAFVPDRQFAEQFLGRVAPYIDVTILQGQRFQSDPRAFHTWISEMIAVVRPPILQFVSSCRWERRAALPKKCITLFRQYPHK